MNSPVLKLKGIVASLHGVDTWYTKPKLSVRAVQSKSLLLTLIDDNKLPELRLQIDKRIPLDHSMSTLHENNSKQE